MELIYGIVFLLLTVALVWTMAGKFFPKSASVPSSSDFPRQNQEANQIALKRQKARLLFQMVYAFRPQLAQIVQYLASHAIDTTTPAELMATHHARYTGAQLLDLTDQLDLLARLESSQIKPALQTVDLVAFLRQMIQTMSSLAVESNLDVQLQTRLSSLVVKLDPGHTERILFNLIHLGITCSPPSTQVILKLQMVAHRVYLGLIWAKGGISSDKISPLLSCLDSDVEATTPHDIMTGVWLLTIRGLIELYHGKMSLDSYLANQQACWIELPMHTGTDAIVRPCELTFTPRLITLFTGA
ncbi:MAG: hypothetical protein AAFV07_00730 [Bacteroidota bacterium]